MARATGTPITGRGVAAATTPARWAAPAGGGDDHLDARAGGAPGEGDGVVGGAVGGEDPDLDRDAEGPEGLDGVVHDRRVG